MRTAGAAALVLSLALVALVSSAGEVGISGEGGGSFSARAWVLLDQGAGGMRAAERLELDLFPLRLRRARGELGWEIPVPGGLSASLRLSASLLSTGRLDLGESLDVSWAPGDWFGLRGGQRAYWTGPDGLPRGTVWVKGNLAFGGLRLEATLEAPVPLASPHYSLALRAGSGDVSLVTSGVLWRSPASVTLTLHGGGERASGGVSFRLRPTPSAQATLSLGTPLGRLRLTGSLAPGGPQAGVYLNIAAGKIKLELGIKASPAGAGWRAAARCPI